MELLDFLKLVYFTYGAEIKVSEGKHPFSYTESDNPLYIKLIICGKDEDVCSVAVHAKDMGYIYFDVGKSYQSTIYKFTDKFFKELENDS